MGRGRDKRKAAKAKATAIGKKPTKAQIKKIAQALQKWAIPYVAEEEK